MNEWMSEWMNEWRVLYTKNELTEFLSAFLNVKGGFLLLTHLLYLWKDPHLDTLDPLLSAFPTSLEVQQSTWLAGDGHWSISQCGDINLVLWGLTLFCKSPDFSHSSCQLWLARRVSFTPQVHCHSQFHLISDHNGDRWLSARSQAQGLACSHHHPS